MEPNGEIYNFYIVMVLNLEKAMFTKKKYENQTIVEKFQMDKKRNKNMQTLYNIIEYKSL